MSLLCCTANADPPPPIESQMEKRDTLRDDEEDESKQDSDSNSEDSYEDESSEPDDADLEKYRKEMLVRAPPSKDDVSLVCTWENEKNEVGELLLGDASNALAAIDGKLPDITDVICVGNRKTAQGCQGYHKHLTESRGDALPSFASFKMADYCPSDNDVDIEKRFLKVLDHVEKKLGDVKQMLDSVDEKAEKTNTVEPTRRILVHCDRGVNRSPTIIMAILIRVFQMPLREAYKQVLQTRQDIDPLPSYRRGLRRMDKKYHSKMSISGAEPFAMHISEVLKQVKLREDDDKLDFAFATREDSISKLQKSPRRSQYGLTPCSPLSPLVANDIERPSELSPHVSEEFKQMGLGDPKLAS